MTNPASLKISITSVFPNFLYAVAFLQLQGVPVDRSKMMIQRSVVIATAFRVTIGYSDRFLFQKGRSYTENLWIEGQLVMVTPLSL